MLSSLIKEHQAKQAAKRVVQGIYKSDENIIYKYTWIKKYKLNFMINLT